MNCEVITSLDHPGVEVYSALTEAQLRNRLEPEKGLFIVESPKVIAVALDAGYEPVTVSELFGFDPPATGGDLYVFSLKNYERK